MDFKEKVVFVTGSTSGIGRATAIRFAQYGANVIVHGNSNLAMAKEVADVVEQQGVQSLLVTGDVSDTAQVNRMFEMIEAHFGRLDVLVNNAGALIKRARLEELDEQLWDTVIDVNLKSVFLVSQRALPMMRKQGGGHIVNVTSIAARNGGGVGSLAYGAAKGGVATLTRGMAKDLIEYNIRVNAIAPGVITTPFHDRFSSPEMRAAWASQIPMHREGTPEETADVVLFLSSGYAKYVIGQIVDVNGGQWFS